MKKAIFFSFIISLTLILFGCGSSKDSEKISEKKAETNPAIIKAGKQAEISYDFTGRYLLPNSNIVFDKNDTNAVADPIVGEFIQLKSGNKYTLVFHRFETDTIKNSKTSEVIFAFELSNLETGVKIYPEKFVYYFMNYGEIKSRIDGKTIHGFLMFDRIDEKAVSGTLNFSIEGKKKTFDQNDVEVTAEFTGSFKVPIGDLKTYKR
jgi:hypothetical protein